jgi:hypothetical protein
VALAADAMGPRGAVADEERGLEPLVSVAARSWPHPPP